MVQITSLSYIFVSAIIHNVSMLSNIFALRQKVSRGHHTVRPLTKENGLKWKLFSYKDLWKYIRWLRT
jgi:hypothetical protein